MRASRNLGSFAKSTRQLRSPLPVLAGVFTTNHLPIYWQQWKKEQQ
jgi:hypothetical protein